MLAALNKDKEPLEELHEAVKIVDGVLAAQIALALPKTAAYFYDDFLGGISQALLCSTHFKDHEVSFFIRSCITHRRSWQ